MASDVEFRKLNNLRVIDLRTELGKRNLDKTGVKNELIERLQKALVSEGHDPEDYVFHVDSTDNKTPRNSKRRTMDDNDGDRDDSLNDSSVVSEDDTKNVKEDMEECIENENIAEEKCNVNEVANTGMGMETTIVQPIEKVTKTKQNEEPAVNTTVNIVQNDNAKEEVENVEIEEKNVKKMENESPKEQRVKKIVNEELKENTVVKYDIKDEEKNSSNVEENVIVKAADVNKEDNEDSINLTIGEDERKLFGEEDDSTSHEKDDKDQPQNTTVETQKENQNDNSKSQSDLKTDDKSTAKKVSIPKGTGNSRNLWVSGLSSMTRATDLKTLFSKYGKVVAAKIVTNAKTPGSRCYGYVTMLSTEDATISMQNLHKTELDGRMILVERAKDDGTGPARSKKEVEKKKPDVKDEKKSIVDEKRKTVAPKTNDTDVKIDEKKVVDKNEKKSSSVKDSNENVAGEVTKASSVKSEKISGHRERSRSSKSKDGSRNQSKDAGCNSRPRTGVLTFTQIKEERERYRLKEKERALRLEERRRQIERERQREIDRRQQQEAVRLERERIKLKIEKDEMRAKMLAIERETQRLERERLMREKEELRRAQQKLEETRKAVKRPLDLPRGYDDDRKRRPPSPDRRHVHISSSIASRKDYQRSNGDRRPSPYSSRRPYDTGRADSRNKDTSQSSRDKSSKDSSRYGSSRDIPSVSKGGVPPAPPIKKFAADDRRYDHHYQSSHGGDEMRSKDARHRYDPSQSSSTSKTSSIKARHDRYPEPPKSSNKDGGRYERNNPNDTWTRQSSSNVSSSKPFNSVSSSSTVSSRDAWASKSEQPPWTRSTVNSSTSDRWGSSSSSTSGMIRSGQLTGSNMYSSNSNYSDSMQTMGMMAMSSGSSYNDRFDAYKSTIRKY